MITFVDTLSAVYV